MKKVLFVAYQIPPIGGPAAQRHIRFLARLRQFQWFPVVLTVKPEHCEDYYQKDYSLEKWLPNDIQVCRTMAFNPMDRLLEFRKKLKAKPRSSSTPFNGLRNISANGYQNKAKAGTIPCLKDILVEFSRIPDRQAGWIPFAVLNGIRIIRSEGIDLIYSSGNPWSAHIVGLILSKLSGFPWVADFRDPWIGNPYKKRRPAIIECIEKKLEKCVVTGAKRIVANTLPLRRYFLENYPYEDERKFVHISNGFFAPMFNSVRTLDNNCQRLVISHVGTLYMHRNPLKLLEALAALKKRGLVKSGDLLLRFIGKIDISEVNLKLLKKLNIDDIVEFTGIVPHNIALQYLVASDLLLLIQPGTNLQIPGKLFEYIAIGKPILALADEGAVTDLMRSEKLGLVVSPHDDKAMQEILLKLLETYKKGSVIGPPKNSVQKFESLHLTRKLATVFQACIQD